MAKKPPFLENQIYHLYNRGADKRVIFETSGDYVQFIHYLFCLNDKDCYENLIRSQKNAMVSEVEPQSFKKRDMLVEILSFCLMPNHFHLLIKQKKEGGIVKFMQKLGTGYTMYFNIKNQRTGCLFQGRFKAKIIDNNAYYMHIPHYIHFNPIDLINDRGSTSISEKMTFLENYRWSSFPDYVGKKNFPSVTNREFLLGHFGGEENYKKQVVEWLKNENNNYDLVSDATFDE
ncbi:MAG: hypothetical protein US50_C0030G0009 [Candidatus Nomurabacteria bacterium GW2011_GWB1_37_5]|uniref:Transposase IS200-like domain-containing protein n=1 Tax=Candidatus Nomurabacteria bacterium GW2011_GWB1_37_5 TaxID=1618742 RepID=A0A0G0GY16_9BACT|nr:MAG: hypothetical protein US50_C0030G0009 [Candidatus Nomurabacteria bacterium GW2011_GWB1_37_5]